MNPSTYFYETYDETLLTKA